jgi:hypothetical protein
LLNCNIFNNIFFTALARLATVLGDGLQAILNKNDNLLAPFNKNIVTIIGICLLIGATAKVFKLDYM